MYLYDKIDKAFERIDICSCVSRFYSDKDNIVIVSDDREDFALIKKIMGKFKYFLYDIGSNGSSFMLTFKKNETS